ncbi:MAG: FtsH protease activity modulator HflK [Candidatus Eisenbacteria bacterium]|nr:FtsH protease activity modulator HflK [Candidatus Eisenbacteria bacterium]
MLIRPSSRIPSLKSLAEGGLARWIVIGIVAIILLATTFYSVATDEVGVVKRLGRHVRTAQPGLHMKLPFAFEKVHKVRVKHVFKEEFGFATERPGVRTVYRRGDFSDQSLMLTGDLNSAVVEWIIQYRIQDPIKYLFEVRGVPETIRDVAEVAMRTIVGDRSVTEVLTIGRREVADQVQLRMQEILDDYGTGVEVVTVNLKDVNPPDPVKPAFNEVNEAKQERETLINEAWAEYNSAIPAAEGEAQRLIRDAEGYAVARVNRAEGEAERFLAVLNEYSRARDVTKRRLYLEAMNDILPKLENTYVVDPELRNLIPLLQLDKKGGQQ